MIVVRAPAAITYRAPRWIERGIELSMHGIFVGFIIEMIEATPGELGGAGKASWTMFSSGALLCIFALFYLMSLGSRGRLPRGLKWWLALSAPVVWIMVAQGVADLPEIDLLHTMRRSVPWVALVLLPVLGAPEFRPRLMRILRWHAILGVIICTVLLVTNWNVVTAKHLYRWEGMELKQGKALLYPLYFLLFQFKELSMVMKSVTGLGILVLVVQSVVSASRQALLLLGITLVIGGWTYLRMRALKGRRAIFMKTALIVAMLLTASVYIFPLMSGALDLTQARFTEESGQSSLHENVRLDELRSYFFEQATVLDLMFGRGVNGRYLHPLGGEAQTMHIGYGRYTLKGGVLVLLLLVCGPFLVGMRLLLRARSPDVLAAAGMCTWFGLKNLTGTIILVHPQFFLIVISFGICLFALARGSDNEDTDETGERSDSIGRSVRKPNIRPSSSIN